MSRPVVDAAALPDYAFGHKGLVWWGTVGFIVIEGSMMVLLMVTYFFLRLRVPEWPPRLGNPDPLFGTINTVLLVASLVPNQLAKSAAERFDLPRLRLWLVVCLVFGAAFTVVRVFEFTLLNSRWDSNAYGSIVWTAMGVHTAHVVTDVLDTGVLTALMFTSHTKRARFVDASDNALYWYFVVGSWVPIYVTIYFGPRWL